MLEGCPPRGASGNAHRRMVRQRIPQTKNRERLRRCRKTTKPKPSHFLVTKWSRTSRPTHLLTQINGEGLLKSVDKTRLSKRHREKLITFRLMTIHPNPGPKGKGAGTGGPSTRRETSVDMTGLARLFNPARHTRRRYKSQKSREWRESRRERRKEKRREKRAKQIVEPQRQSIKVIT